MNHDHRFSGEELVMAMADIDTVVSGFSGASRQHHEFANTIQQQWHSELGPSRRYLRALVQRYLRQVGAEQVEGSEELSELLMLIMMRGKEEVRQSMRGSYHDAAPNPDESCHVSFGVSRTSNVPCIIRIFPHHNDVGLRIWEAGVALAEFLLSPAHRYPHTEILQQVLAGPKSVVELGAGTGLTGLVAASLPNVHRVHCTDYTERCLDNLEYNIQTNQAWLEGSSSKPVCISSGYLEWDAVGKLLPVLDDSAEGYFDPSNLETTISQHCSDKRLQSSIRHLSQATLLLAADVAYDVTLIRPLAQTIRFFLQYPSSRSPQPRCALVATTVRNHQTFVLLQDVIDQEGITSTLLLDDCSKLHCYFPHKFIQPRSDVKIYQLTYCSENSRSTLARKNQKLES